MAEELGVDQGLGQRAAVDGDKGATAARAQAVDVAGHHFLVGAAVAQDEDAGLAGGHLSHGLEQGLRGRVLQYPRRGRGAVIVRGRGCGRGDRKSTRLNSSHLVISYAVFCLKKKKSAAPLTAYIRDYATAYPSRACCG